MNEEVEKKYLDVQTVLGDALQKANSAKLTGTDENAELTAIRTILNKLNTDFEKEIEILKNSSEWDKFCIAFFGETNAGKSTIIETLRVIYDEETRRADAMAQKEQYHHLMKQHCADYGKLVASLREVNAAVKARYGRNCRWLFYILAGVLGVGVGLLLANLGIGLW